MSFFNNLPRKTPYWIIAITMATLALAGCSGGGGGGGGGKSAGPTTTPLTIKGIVNDAIITSAQVELLLDGTVVATTTSNGSGQYSFSLNTTAAQRAQVAVIQARRGNLALQSLLGVLQSVVNTKNSSNSVTQSNFPQVVVSNVTTAMIAVMQQQNGGTLPTDQAGIDALVATIRSDSGLQTLVTRIAAAIKAVVDYGADPTSINGSTDTQTLANYLANNVANIDTNMSTLIATANGGVTEADLTNQVQTDPLTAAQLPTTVSDADIVGHYYLVGNNTMLYFPDTSNMIINQYSNISTGNPGNSGTWSYATGVLTLQFTDNKGAHTIVATILGGNPNAFELSVVFDGVPDDNVVMQRMEPVGTNDNIAESDLTGQIFVDFAGSNASKFSSSCDRVTKDGWVSGTDGTLPAACDTVSGMIVISPDWAAVSLPDGGKIIIALLADAWDSTAMSVRKSTSFISWEKNPTNGNVVQDGGRGYVGRNSGANPCFSCPAGTTSQPIKLRFDTDGKISMRLLVSDFVDAINPGKQIIFSNSAAPNEKYFKPGQTVGGWPYAVNQSADDMAGTIRPRVVVNLGNYAGSELRALFKVDNLTNNAPLTVMTRVQYNLQQMTEADLAGKTFTVTHLDQAGTETFTFNGDGTGSVTNQTGTGPFTWSVGADPVTNAAFGGSGNPYNTVLIDWGGGEIAVLYRSADLGNGSYMVGALNTYLTPVILTPQ